MTIHDDIRQALYDAIGWQRGLSEAWPDGSPEWHEAIDQIKTYRRILKRRYGDERSPIDKQLAGAQLVSIFDLKKQP